MHKLHQRVLVTLKLSALTVCALTLLSVSALAQQPITYQGFLRVNGLPANGEFDFRFRLFDSATGTNQVGTTVIADDKQVRQGFYTVVLDFGNVWTGGQRWLEIAIRPGNSTGSYTTLSPRVQLTPVPLAHQAFSVPWSGVTGFTIASPLTGTGTSGNPLRLINGTSAGQILKWNGSQWALANDNDTTYSAGRRAIPVRYDFLHRYWWRYYRNARRRRSHKCETLHHGRGGGHLRLRNPGGRVHGGRAGADYLRK
jgi:hypothetical protein